MANHKAPIENLAGDNNSSVSSPKTRKTRLVFESTKQPILTNLEYVQIQLKYHNFVHSLKKQGMIDSVCTPLPKRRDIDGRSVPIGVLIYSKTGRLISKEIKWFEPDAVTAEVTNNGDSKSTSET